MSNTQVVHSKLSFSGRYRWKHCGVSVAWSSGMPDKSSPAAAEGTCAHTVGEFYVRQAFGIIGHVPAPAEAPVQHFPDGFDPKGKSLEQWNAELRTHGKAYAAFIQSLIPPGAVGHVVLEEKVAASKIHPQLFGTADALLWLPATKTLIVIDYKYGFVEVDIGTVEDTNPQLSAYAVAAVEQWMLDFETIKLAVFQPRRTFGVPASPIELSKEWHTAERAKLAREVAAVETATEPVPGDWCRYCKAKSKCPKVTNALDTGLRYAAHTVDVLTLPDDMIIDLWASRTAIKALLDDVQERVDGLVKAGHKRLSVKETKGRRMWADPAGAALALMSLGRTDLLAPVAVSDAAPHLPEDWQKALITHSAPSRSIKLVTDIDPSQVATTFAQYVKKP